MSTKKRFVLFGAGRIGALHAGNVAENERSELLYVVDTNLEAAKKIAGETGAFATSDSTKPLEDPNVDAVLIASPTPTHVALITAAAKHKKAIFCEKPVDLDLGRALSAKHVVEETGATCFIGFNRRFDTHFSKLKSELPNIGRVEFVSITSRDPAPPPLSYVEVSGGLFKDMMIHDFDLARWILDEPVVEITSLGSALITKELPEYDDVDTAAVIMKTESGKICQISNSRRAVYGYDQRVEVLGEKGALLADNPQTSTVRKFYEGGQSGASIPYFFLERYLDAYRTELNVFLDGLEEKSRTTLPRDWVSVYDGIEALRLGIAAKRSLKEGRSIRLSDIAP